MAHKRKNVKSKEQKRSSQSLKAIQPYAAGIDLGSREHWVAGPPREDGTPNVQRFSTTIPELLRLTDWLKEQGVETVAMESTGVYWIPLFEILDSRGFEVVLANARQISNVPGRKTVIADYDSEILTYITTLQPADAGDTSAPPPASKTKAKNLVKRGQEPMRPVSTSVELNFTLRPLMIWATTSNLKKPKKSNAIFMKFHTRLQSTDFVVVLVPYKILIYEDEHEDEKNQIRSHAYTLPLFRPAAALTPDT